MFDFNLHYNYVGRYILNLKQSKKKIYFNDIMKLEKITLFFDIREIKDINSISILNSIYFFQYYFGVLPNLNNYSYNFKLNYNYYSFTISFDFYKNQMYYPLYFLSNDISNVINKTYVVIYQEKHNLIYTVKDMNFFSEKKNSIGFFNLKHEITFNLQSNLTNYFEFFDLLMIFKLRI